MTGVGKKLQETAESSNCVSRPAWHFAWTLSDVTSESGGWKIILVSLTPFQARWWQGLISLQSESRGSHSSWKWRRMFKVFQSVQSFPTVFQVCFESPIPAPPRFTSLQRTVSRNLVVNRVCRRDTLGHRSWKLWMLRGVPYANGSEVLTNATVNIEKNENPYLIPSGIGKVMER